MPAYERFVDGQVVERVVAIEGSHEDTRLGVAALEGAGGWRLVEGPAVSAPSEQEGDGDGVRDPGGAGRVARSRTGT